MDKKVYKVGDTIEITQEMVDTLKKNGTRGFRSDWSAWLGKKGTCFIQRLDRQHGQMAVNWGDNEKTNAWWLSDAGIEFEEVDCPELPIMECPEEYLSTSELVIKTLIKEGNTEAEATAKVYEVQRAMAEHGIVFYIP